MLQRETSDQQKYLIINFQNLKIYLYIEGEIKIYFWGNINFVDLEVVLKSTTRRGLCDIFLLINVVSLGVVSITLQDGHFFHTLFGFDVDHFIDVNLGEAVNMEEN